MLFVASYPSRKIRNTWKAPDHFLKERLWPFIKGMRQKQNLQIRPKRCSPILGRMHAHRVNCKPHRLVVRPSIQLRSLIGHPMNLKCLILPSSRLLRHCKIVYKSEAWVAIIYVSFLLKHTNRWHRADHLYVVERGHIEQHKHNSWIGQTNHLQRCWAMIGSGSPEFSDFKKVESISLKIYFFNDLPPFRLLKGM